MSHREHPLTPAPVSDGLATFAPDRQARLFAGALWMIAPAWYLLCEAVTAAGFPGYNYAQFYISDLGVAEHADFEGRALESHIPQVMNSGFIGAGLLFLVGLLVLFHI